MGPGFASSPWMHSRSSRLSEGFRPLRVRGRGTYALADLIRGRIITCTGDKRDRNGRPLVVCELDGTDLGRALIRAGWAVPEYGHPYDAEWDKARMGRLGAWAGTFVTSREWRSGKR